MTSCSLHENYLHTACPKPMRLLSAVVPERLHPWTARNRDAVASDTQQDSKTKLSEVEKFLEISSFDFGPDTEQIEKKLDKIHFSDIMNKKCLAGRRKFIFVRIEGPNPEKTM